MRRLILVAALGAAGLTGGVARAEDGLTWTIQAEDQPESRPWTDPASFSFKSVSGGDDIFDIAFAVKAEGASTSVGSWERSPFASAAAIRRTNPGKEQEFYGLKIGAGLVYSSVSTLPQTEAQARKALTLYLDPAVGLTQTTTFKDPKAVCTPPAPATCRDQRESSFRAEIKGQLFVPAWSNAPFATGGVWNTDKPFLFDFAPTGSLFYDRVIDAKEDASGAKMRGSVTAAQLTLSGAYTPRLTADPDLAYRLVFRASGKYFYALDRTGPRAAAYPRDATLWTASATYEFGVRSFEGAKGWTPSFGVTYTSGEDPTKGRPKSEDVTFAFKIALQK